MIVETKGTAGGIGASFMVITSLCPGQRALVIDRFGIVLEITTVVIYLYLAFVVDTVGKAGGTDWSFITSPSFSISASC
ncbi:MAG TPA: hypothetical protein VFJ65_05185 [Solirubrobacterales bacterium]|nr:hypothetical protein [Solirubrobacterales bacterium]